MYTNRLADEKSPYLLQHAHNPVDWYAWGDAAFEKARTEDKPIFLSIGYSTCHWCHVMERESFESVEVAEVLNREFVPVKVDREERPDVDRIYMSYVQASTGSGGWPMSVWLAPDLKPFYGGTYFPPDNRYGRPGFKTLLEYIANAWRTERERIAESSRNIVEELKRHSEVKAPASGLGADEQAIDSCFQVFRRMYDPRYGGFGQAPKFPRPVAFEFLHRFHARTGNEEAIDMAVDTLRAMARGGMYDQVGGGFHRYSVDEHWLVPHFEKMLYDQGQLATAYLEAYQITGEQDLADVARDVFEYVLRDMTDGGGAFYSAEDADSVIDPSNPHEKGEGAFYIWSEKELREVLRVDADKFVRAYGVQPNGNVDSDPHGEFTGRNILHRVSDVVMSADVRAKLMDVRGRRVRPHLDDKILTAWNGLMISAFALGARVLGERRYLDPAKHAADFILANMRSPDGSLLRRWRAGEAAIEGFLDDYALFATALVDLYEASFEPKYLKAAVELTERMIALFEDREQGGFFSTAEGDANLVLRLKDEYDGAEPSGNSSAAALLFRLYAMTDREEFREAGARTLVTFGQRLRSAPHATPRMICAAMNALGSPNQIVFAGDRDSDLVRAANARFLPNYVLLYANADLLPKTGGMTQPGAYVCRNFVCELPVTTVDALNDLLK